MSGVLFGRFFERVLSISVERMSIASRGAVSAGCRRTVTTTKQLASRESDLNKIAGIATHNRLTPLDRKMFVLTRVFKSESEIPATLPQTQINRVRDVVRIGSSCFMMVLFLIAVPFYISSGRRSRARGDTEIRRTKEWVAQLRREKLAEEAAARGQKQLASST
ncbi:hypothetical protein NP493_216g03015 [Ridgeia piscesae]|uniref:Transmembrane protein n=1 Tax=Ridgeia piscesae TaxID=27915 RepID=A0AAD9UE54_RIDPI|nr:hypothetical protein NP493_3864g00011 [Ridgeia piscesae]KAK2186034.1 hypothetical protein NP493_216g03015 [Ridgeia piscesae]